MAIKTDKPPLVSVLVSLSNRKENVKTSIESCLGQQYRNVEVIVIDDCTNQHLSELARSCEPWVRIVSVPRHLNAHASQNVGLSYALGDFVLFHETGDLLFADRLSYDLEVAQGTRADLVMSVNRLVRNGESTRYDAEPICRREKRLLRHITSIAGPTEGALTNMLQYGAPPHSCVLYRTSVVRALGGYADDCKRYAERELLFRAVSRGATVSVNARVTSARQFQEEPAALSPALRRDDMLQQLALGKRYTLAVQRAGLMDYTPLRDALITHIVERIYEPSKDFQFSDLAGAALNLIATLQGSNQANQAKANSAGAGAQDSAANKFRETFHV